MIDILIGFSFPTEKLLARETLYKFVETLRFDPRFPFSQASLLRHPSGAYFIRNDRHEFFASFDEFGSVFWRHILRTTEISARGDVQQSQARAYPFFWISKEIFYALACAAKLYESTFTSREIMIEADLLNLARKDFYFTTGNMSWDYDISVTMVDSMPSSVVVEATQLNKDGVKIASDLLYGLSWPFGGDRPYSKEDLSVHIGKVAVQNKLF